MYTHRHISISIFTCIYTYYKHDLSKLPPKHQSGYITLSADSAALLDTCIYIYIGVSISVNLHKYAIYKYHIYIYISIMLFSLRSLLPPDHPVIISLSAHSAAFLDTCGFEEKAIVMYEETIGSFCSAFLSFSYDIFLLSLIELMPF